MSTAVRAPLTFDRSDDLAALARCLPDRVRFVHVPARRYLAVDGTETPGGATFQSAVTTIYPIAYGLHSALMHRGVTAPVGMLEALYWLRPRNPGATDAGQPELGGPRRWRLILPLPQEAGEQEVQAAIQEASGRHELAALDRLRVVNWEEGPSAELLHIGPYAAETEALRILHATIHQVGLVRHGPHHEIYLNDPRRVGEENARTVLRQPVRWPDDR
jgi:hypothetical protein